MHVTMTNGRVDLSNWPAVLVMTRFTFGAWIGLAFAFAFAATWPFRGDWAQGVANGTMSRPLAHARSWRVERNRIDRGDLAADRSDLLVIDAAKNDAAPTGRVPLTATEIARLKVRPDGTRRLVIARLSAGEAGKTSATWSGYWNADPPEWLGEHHCTRPNVRRVRFWLPDWKNSLFRAPGSHLERIIAAGFDGVYLDGLDVFASFEVERPDARNEMIQHVRELAAAARARRPGFIVIAQNAEALLSDPDYRMVIDGIGKESLLYSWDASGVRKKPSEIKQSIAFLRLLQKDGKPVFALEYLRTATLIDQTALALRRRGFVPAFETRPRDGLEPATSRKGQREGACPPGTVW